MTHIKLKKTPFDLDLDDEKMMVKKTKFLKMDKAKALKKNASKTLVMNNSKTLKMQKSKTLESIRKLKN